MKKKLFSVILLLCLAAMAAGCQPGEDTVYQERQTDFPISPVADSGSGITKSVTLYFGFQDEEFLSTETRLLQMPLDESPEAFIIRQLIQGPSVTYADLRGLFNPMVEVVSVESSARMLTVTLSENFLDPPAEAPPGWQDDGEWVERVHRRNRLALYSMVNTITELGEYDRLQLQVEMPDDTTGDTARRIKMSDVALAPSEQEDALLGAVGRAYDEVLSPKRVVDIVLGSWSRQDWERIYSYLVSVDEEGNPRPLRDEIASQLTASPATIISYSVLGSSVAANGKTAIVSLDFEYRRSDGSTDTLQNTVIKLMRENEAWKMVYASLEALSGTQG